MVSGKKASIPIIFYYIKTMKVDVRNMNIYQNPEYSPEERAKNLVSIMTTKEKIGQLNQNMLGWNAYKLQGDNVCLTKEFQDEVAFGDGLGAIYGVFRADGWNSHVTMGVTPEEGIKIANAIQKYVIENTRLGIPVLFSEECPHGHEALQATTFPVNIGIGSTWNPELYEKMCRQISIELRARGGHLALVSALDIATDPRWGRTEECYSEDPFLSARFCEKAVTGIQGKRPQDLKKNAAIVLKHFCAQGATIGGHNGKSTNIGMRELYEIHLKGMRKGAQAGAVGCMAAYNDIDGIPCHCNPQLLTNILRNEMGFEGFVMSDGKGVDRLAQMTGSFEKAGAMAVHAGVDLNLWNTSFLKLQSALEKGLLDETELDQAVFRILKIKFQMGLFENPFIDGSQTKQNIGSHKSKEVALQLARESIVLLKNENQTLPLNSSYKKIAVIGPNAHNVYNQLGDYTQWQENGKVITIWDGIKSEAPKNVQVQYVQGCSVRGYDKDEFKAARLLAEQSDVVVLVLGGSSTREADMTFQDNGAVFMNQFTSEIDCGEAVDLADLCLGGVQQELAIELKKTGKPLIVILIQGRPHAIPWFKENADAILCAWYPGEQGGKAIGEILFGKINPSGKLSISIPINSAQLPVYYNRKDESKYVDMEAIPLYPFGYGLSYTTFSYEEFHVNHDTLSREELANGAEFCVKFSIKNTGNFSGKSVPQLYIYDMESCVTRRIQELKDFEKIEIDPGSSQVVTLKIGAEELGVLDYNMNYVIEPGNIKLMIGDSSNHIIHEQNIRIT